MTDWSRPVELTDVEVAFGDVSRITPAWEEIPSEFKAHGRTTWNKFQSDWFFLGLDQPRYKVKEGVDLQLALTQLGSIQRSFTLKHEHKEAAVAYLASLWFKTVVTKGKKYG